LRTKEGKEAKAWLEDALMPLGFVYVQTLQHKTKAKRDKYGRFLAVLFDDTSDMQASGPTKTRVCPSSINARMITEGHAKERYW
jgi:endonuclease YncB( thermonuclease family)